MLSEMLIAHTSGFVEDDGQLVEITAGKSRISPEVLGRSGYQDFFDGCVTARGTHALRSIIRTTTPDGRMIADTQRFGGRPGA